MTDIFTAVSNFGFPIVISIYLLTRFEKKLESLTKVIEKNNSVTQSLIEAVKKSNKGIKISNKVVSQANEQIE